MLCCLTKFITKIFDCCKKKLNFSGLLKKLLNLQQDKYTLTDEEFLPLKMKLGNHSFESNYSKTALRLEYIREKPRNISEILFLSAYVLR